MLLKLIYLQVDLSGFEETNAAILFCPSLITALDHPMHLFAGTYSYFNPLGGYRLECVLESELPSRV